jgi:hypothetical protein
MSAEFLEEIDRIVNRKYMIVPDWAEVVDEVRAVIVRWRASD